MVVGGKPLIAWQVEALARAGFRDIVVNAAWLAPQMVAALGDGDAFGVRIRWSLEPEPLETAGGIATAVPLLPPGPALIVSADIWTRFDYATLASRTDAMARSAATPRVHLVMVPNPPYHPEGDFALTDGHVALAGDHKLTFGNIAIYDTALFRELPRGTRLKLLPFFREWIARGWVSGERFDGPWANVGTPADLAALDRAITSSQGNTHE
jgi:MurNAc alpha-1-phosphate uridylyltransferase